MTAGIFAHYNLCMNPMTDLLSRIEQHCKARDISESTFGRYVVNDGKFVGRLRSGGTLTLKTLERVETALSQGTRRPR